MKKEFILIGFLFLIVLGTFYFGIREDKSKIVITKVIVEPERVPVGKMTPGIFYVAVDLKNTGDSNGKREVELTIEKLKGSSEPRVIDTKKISIPSGDTENIIFSATIWEIGEFKCTVSIAKDEKVIEEKVSINLETYKIT